MRIKGEGIGSKWVIWGDCRGYGWGRNIAFSPISNKKKKKKSILYFNHTTRLVDMDFLPYSNKFSMIWPQTSDKVRNPIKFLKWYIKCLPKKVLLTKEIRKNKLIYLMYDFTNGTHFRKARTSHEGQDWIWTYKHEQATPLLPLSYSQHRMLSPSYVFMLHINFYNTKSIIFTLLLYHYHNQTTTEYLETNIIVP